MHAFPLLTCGSGQTGSGKTFTMMGAFVCCLLTRLSSQIRIPFENRIPPLLCCPSMLTGAGPLDEHDQITEHLRGIIPRCFELLFGLIQRDKQAVRRKKGRESVRVCVCVSFVCVFVCLCVCMCVCVCV